MHLFSKASLLILAATVIGVEAAHAIKFDIDIHSPVACDEAFVGREQVAAVDSSVACKVKIRVTNKGKALTSRKIRFSERLTSGQGVLKSSKTDSKGYVTFSFKVGEASCYFSAIDVKTEASKSILLLLNNEGICGV